MEENAKFTLEELDEMLNDIRKQYNELNEQKEALINNKKNILKEQQEARKKEVDEAYVTYHKLKTAYLKDYGNYYIPNYDKDNTFNKLFDNLFFY